MSKERQTSKGRQMSNAIAVGAHEEAKYCYSHAPTSYCSSGTCTHVSMVQILKRS